MGFTGSLTGFPTLLPEIQARNNLPVALCLYYAPPESAEDGVVASALEFRCEGLRFTHLVLELRYLGFDLRV